MRLDSRGIRALVSHPKLAAGHLSLWDKLHHSHQKSNSHSPPYCQGVEFFPLLISFVSTPERQCSRRAPGTEREGMIWWLRDSLRFDGFQAVKSTPNKKNSSTNQNLPSPPTRLKPTGSLATQGSRNLGPSHRSHVLLHEKEPSRRLGLADFFIDPSRFLRLHPCLTPATTIAVGSGLDRSLGAVFRSHTGLWKFKAYHCMYVHTVGRG
jgi:hypothetical protein